MLRGGALLYTVLVTFLIGTLLSFIILASYSARVETLDHTGMERAHRNAQSGINLLLARQELLELHESREIDLFGDDHNKVILSRKPWGAFEIAISRAIIGRTISDKMALIGYYSPPEMALYLADRDRPLSLCGNTLLKGDCYLPKTGTKRSYIEGQSFSRERMVEGAIKESTRDLPGINEELLKQICSFEDAAERMDSVMVFDEKDFPDTIVNSFTVKTIRIIIPSGARLAGKYFSGNIILSGEGAVTVDASVVLKDVLIYAPGIVLDENFEGSLQAIAGDSLIIRRNCRLHYPSVAGVIRSNKIPLPGSLVVEEGCVLTGVALGYSRDGDLRYPVKVSVGKGAVVHGLVYSNNLTEIKGTVYGSVYAGTLTLQTPSSVYENHLLNATIDATRRSLYFTGINLLKASGERRVVKWVD